MLVSNKDRKRIRQETLNEAYEFIHTLAFKQLGSQGWGYDDEFEALANQIKNLPEKK